ncbi:TPA: DNA methyltransferase [Aeromonas hydrophila]
MRQALDKTLRNQLESTVLAAREVVETACREEIERLGVADATVPAFLNDAQRKLRNRLRAHARQLGDPLHDNGKQETAHLLAEMAYEQWHRMLFARFLEQNNLLMYDAYTPVTLDECAELLDEETDCASSWELAGRLAAKMLPQVFRVDSPVLAVRLPINHQRTLEGLIMALSPAVFEAQDSLGWCYQFWQSKRKDEVNKSGDLIGADELSPVTQLFTEPYMVSFLLDNALGAWWAKRRLTDDHLRHASDEQELRERAATPGVPLTYLRFVKVTDTQGERWQPAGGWYDAWPEDISELKTLDPCCGSGHFLVALFLMLVPMRMQLEGCNANTAIERVITQNLHGLELDSRCIEIAAFALALEAWRYPSAGGYRDLPEMQLACSGLSISEAQKEWKDLAKGDEDLSNAIAWMLYTFKDAPILGSLIDPTTSLKKGQLPPWESLLQVIGNKYDISNESRVMAYGLVKAAQLLSKKYDVVLTNPPYLGDRKQCEFLKKYSQLHFPIAKSELANVMYLRASKLLKRNGCGLFVYPESWLTLTRSEEFRRFVLKNQKVHILIRLGDNSFDNKQAKGASVCMSIFSNSSFEHQKISSLDLFKLDSIDKKNDALIGMKLGAINQCSQLENRQARVIFDYFDNEAVLLETMALANQGVKTGDDSFWRRNFWEVEYSAPEWEFFQSTVSFDVLYGGRSDVINWATQGDGMVRPRKGNKSIGLKGIAISQMGSLPCTIYTGELYDSNVAPIVPFDKSNLDVFWSFFVSDKFESELRKIDSKKSITNATFLKVPFVPEEPGFPLPEPFSDDPTQWIFHGHPCASVVWDEESKWTKEGPVRFDDTVLQVAVARLLGYQWPAELDQAMELADEQRQLVDEVARLNMFADEDGIVCLPAVRGEAPAHTRLEKLLVAAYEDDWKAGALDKLLAAVGSKSLELWLRDKFFEQHCKLFQHRPFIWHIWDGLKDGFSALVNYHKLDRSGLERLIYTYLGDWIRIQEQGVKEARDGAEERLTAAKNLQQRLEAILLGEQGLDIFVRWKSLAEQPIGWEPDLDDGVRLNIRPFLKAADVGKKGAGILRFKPNINWNKDRGNDVASAPWYTLGLQYGEKEGARINDHHLSLADKRAARANQPK